MSFAKETAVVIPAYKPDDRLPPYVEALKTAGVGKIVIVDDGSDVFVTDEGEVIHGREVPANDGSAEVAFVSHWATCPVAGQFRRKR